MDFEPTPLQREVIAAAAALARQALEPRAALYDRTGAHPRESWQDLWRAGFLAAAVPEKHGGRGLDMLTYVMLLEQLAQGCVNTTMTLHMHSVVQMYIDALASPAQKARFYPEVVEQGKVYGSWGSADALQRAVLAARAKSVATEAALMVTSQAIRLVGGRSAHRRCPLERLFRDVRTATLMPPNADRSLEIVGKAMLAVPDAALLARHAG